MARIRRFSYICKWGGISGFAPSLLVVFAGTDSTFTRVLMFASFIAAVIGFVGVRSWKQYAKVRREYIDDQIRRRGVGPNGELYATGDEIHELQELAIGRVRRRGNEIVEVP